MQLQCFPKYRRKRAQENLQKVTGAQAAHYCNEIPEAHHGFVFKMARNISRLEWLPACEDISDENPDPNMERISKNSEELLKLRYYILLVHRYIFFIYFIC